jgi:hypothetical protein
MKWFACVLLALGCSFDAESFSATVADPASFPEQLVCGWSPRDVQPLEVLPPGRCWFFVPDGDVAATPLGAEPCDVDRAAVVFPGDVGAVRVWSSTSSHGRQPFAFEGRACP